ncbi:hypothetical protein ONR75_16260 [Rhodopseudomonas sp. P2A-2r]|nr:hypothetical protein [Rhodopseudomonas sp. P2A-2r]UZE51978.1 hypothetical protein ONR75_16260 [Rhodopseudomonas sp. P2A-2r]
MPQQGVGGCPVTGRQRDAHTQSDIDDHPLDHEGLAHGADQPLGETFGISPRRIVLQDDEFVATEADHQIALAQRSLETDGDLDQQLVADHVAHGVVDLFEAVEIHEQHGGRTCAVVDVGEDLRHPAVEGVAVRQAGQGIVIGEMGDLPADLQLLGDVLVQGDPAAIGERAVDDLHGPAVPQQGERRGLLGVTVLAHALGVILLHRQARLVAAQIGMREHIDVARAWLHDRRIERIVLDILGVADHQPFVGAVHRQAVRQMEQHIVKVFGTGPGVAELRAKRSRNNEHVAGVGQRLAPHGAGIAVGQDDPGFGDGARELARQRQLEELVRQPGGFMFSDRRRSKQRVQGCRLFVRIRREQQQIGKCLVEQVDAEAGVDRADAERQPSQNGILKRRIFRR